MDVLDKSRAIADLVALWGCCGGLTCMQAEACCMVVLWSTTLLSIPLPLSCECVQGIAGDSSSLDGSRPCQITLSLLGCKLSIPLVSQITPCWERSIQDRSTSQTRPSVQKQIQYTTASVLLHGEEESLHCSPSKAQSQVAWRTRCYLLRVARHIGQAYEVTLDTCLARQAVHQDG